MPQKSRLISIVHMLSDQKPCLHAILCEAGNSTSGRRLCPGLPPSPIKTSWLGCHHICCVGVCVGSVCECAFDRQVPHFFFNVLLSGMGKKDDPKLMQEWFKLVQEKNALVRYESELMIL